QGGVSALLLESCRLRLYTGGRDGTAAEWDLRKPTCPVVVYGGHNGWVTSLELLPQPLTTSTDNRHVEYCWETAAGVFATATTPIPTAATATAATCPSPHGLEDISLLRALDPLTCVAENWHTPRHAAQRPIDPFVDFGVGVLSRPSPCLVTGSTDWTVRIWSPGATAPAATGISGLAAGISPAVGISGLSAPAGLADAGECSNLLDARAEAQPSHCRTLPMLDDFRVKAEWLAGRNVAATGTATVADGGAACWSIEGNRRDHGASLSPRSSTSTCWTPRDGGNNYGAGGGDGAGGANNGGGNDIELMGSSDGGCGQMGGHRSDSPMDGGGARDDDGGSSSGSSEGVAGCRSGLKPSQPAASPCWRTPSPTSPPRPMPSPASTSTCTTSSSSFWQQQVVRYCQKPKAVLVGHGGAVTALYVDKSAGAGPDRCGDAAASITASTATIYTGAQDGSVGAWTADGHCQQLLPGHRGAVVLLATTSVSPPLTSSLLSNFTMSTSPHPHLNCSHHNNSRYSSINEMGSDFGRSTAAGTQLAAQKPDRTGPFERLLVTSGAEGSAGLWTLTHGSLGYSPLLDRNDTGSLARVAAWDAARGVLLRGDERGVVRAWVPGA
ncbi:hypothetical protein Vretifemale_13505, partial [Volvox reticuliferus]